MTISPIPWPLQREPMTYRQMQFWISRFPELFSDKANPGTGYARELTWTDIERLRRMARLVDAGLRPAAAARAAVGDGYHRLSAHVVLRVSA